MMVMAWIAYSAGVALLLLTLFDVYRTVLSNGMGRGPIESTLSHRVWLSLRWLGERLGRRPSVSAVAGPLIVILLITSWSLLLTLAFALIYWPQLGSGVRSSDHGAMESFSFAFYYSGFTLTTLGIGDLYPATDGVRGLSVVESWLGFTMLTLTISYILSVYQAVRLQNAIAHTLHALSRGTGRSLRLFGAIHQPGGSAAQTLDSLHFQFVELFTSHHQYPVIHYFQREEERYSTTRMLFLALDAVTLTLAMNRDSGRASAEAFQVSLSDALSEFAQMVAGDGLGESECADLPKDLTTRAEAVSKTFGLEGPVAEAIDQEKYLAARSDWEPRVRCIARYFGEDWSAVDAP